MLDPHMRYQSYMNNSGLFSPLPSANASRALWDDIMLGGRLANWSVSTFRENIIDKCLG